MSRILVAAPDRGWRRSVRDWLAALGVEVIEASTATAALAAAADRAPDLVLFDVRMCGGSDWRALSELGAQAPDARLIAVASPLGIGTARSVVRAGAAGVVSRSISPDLLREQVARHLATDGPRPEQQVYDDLLAMAATCAEAGRVSEAEEYARAALGLDTQRPAALDMLGEIAARRGNLVRAQALHRAARAVDAAATDGPG